MSVWYGYYKVAGRYGDFTREACAVGANLLISGIGDEDTALPLAQRLTRQQAFINEALARGAALIGTTTDADITLLRSVWHRVACLYVTPEGTSTNPMDAASVERQIVACEAILKEYGLVRRPFLCYMDTKLDHTYRLPKGVDWQAINMYLGPEAPATLDDCIAQLAQRWHDQIQYVPDTVKLMAVAQAYDRNGVWQNADLLARMQDQYGTYARHPRSVGALFFSYSRPGGVTTYPALQAAHKALFGRNSGQPAIVTVPWPTPPAPPTPPTPEPVPEPPAPRPEPPPAPPVPQPKPPTMSWWTRLVRWVARLFHW